MKLLCIFPITGNEGNIQHIFGEWKKLTPTFETLGASKLDIKFTRVDYSYVPTNKSFEGVPKGRGILECLKNCSETPDCVLVCDGSNKIPYSYLIDVFRELVSDISVHCVMGNRTNNKAISEHRYLIERFEIFMLKRYHKHDEDIPDGQCGIWGYKTGKLSVNGTQKEIALTAEEYEVELDLLSEVLEKKLNQSFVEIALPETRIGTQFTFEKNLVKLRFLFKKYGGLKENVQEYLGEFEKENKSRIGGLSGESLQYWAKYKQEITAMPEQTPKMEREARTPFVTNDSLINLWDNEYDDQWNKY